MIFRFLPNYLNMEHNLSSLDLPTENYQALKALGFINVHEVTETTNISGWPELIAVPTTKTALDIYCENRESGTIYTFNKEFDDLLQSEMSYGNIVEISGEPGSGKTQLCFQLCINVQLPKWLGGQEGGALYLCTNYNFSTERLRELCQIILNKLLSMEVSTEKKLQLLELNVDKLLKNIHHIQINTYDELVAVAVYLQKWLKHNKIRLLIIDCITLINQQLHYKEKSNFIYQLFADVQRLATRFKFVVVITNNMSLRIKSANDIYKTPGLGDAYFHRINSRIILEKLADNYFKATLEKSVMKKTKCTAILNFI